jgi:hypothetical protein
MPHGAKGILRGEGGVYPHRSRVLGTTPAGQGWPSVPVAKDGEKGPLEEVDVSRLDESNRNRLLSVQMQMV